MPGQTVKLAALAGSDLTARGYHAQVHAQDDSLALFHLDGGRRAIRQQDGRFVVGDQQFPAAALVAQATDAAGRHSARTCCCVRSCRTRSSRPSVTSPDRTSSPISASCAASTSISACRCRSSTRARRRRILDSAALRFLTKYKLPLEALQAQDEAALNELLKTQIPPVVEESFTEAEKAIDAQMTHLVPAMPALDPTLEGAARSTLERMQRDLQTLHGKMIQAAKRRDETLRRQFIHARALAFPGGHAQERTIGFLSFLNQYGPALVDRLDEELPLDLGRHWIVTI